MKRLEFVNNCYDADVVTHGGVFHADEVFGTAILLIVSLGTVGPLKICRTFKVPDDIEYNKIVFDIGGGRFDHHQTKREYRDCNERFSIFPYAAAGLLWREFGKHAIIKILDYFESEIIEKLENKDIDRIWKQVDQYLFEAIDAADNGVELNDDIRRIQGVSYLISTFNPSWNSKKEKEKELQERGFYEAVEMALSILYNEVRKFASFDEAEGVVYDAFINNTDKGVMSLDRFCPWQEHLSRFDVAKTTKCVEFPSNRGGYNVQMVPVEPGSFETMVHPPKEWCGAEEKDLPKGMTFCHPTGFLFATKDKESALAYAEQVAKTE